ncbi:hypothetical protein BGZ60DRAFT_369633, partial [Tricladium varicosporioides]
ILWSLILTALIGGVLKFCFVVIISNILFIGRIVTWFNMRKLKPIPMRIIGSVATLFVLIGAIVLTSKLKLHSWSNHVRYFLTTPYSLGLN